MSRIFASAEQLIGSTPLLRLHRIEQAHQLKAVLLAKLFQCEVREVVLKTQEERYLENLLVL